MEVKAKLRFLRVSPKKVRLVADLIRGLTVDQALVQLAHLNKGVKTDLMKLLNSAIANAENNFELKKDNLFVKEIRVDMGGVLKRWLPRAQGRATPIRKNMSHVSLILAEIEPTQKGETKKTVKKKVKQEKTVKVKSLDEVKKTLPGELIKGSGKEDVKAKGHEKEAGKEIVDPRMEGKHRHQQNQDKSKMKGKKGFMQKVFNRKSG